MLARRRYGFTLIELLVVVAIIVILIAMLLPSVGRAKELSRRAVCGAGLHALGIGMREYATMFGDYCPLGMDPRASDSPTSENDSRDSAYIFYEQKSGSGNGLPNGVCDFTGHGKLFQIGAVTAKKAWFCPSFLLNKPGWLPAGDAVGIAGLNSGYGTNPENPTWQPFIDKTLSFNTETRSSYSRRPAPPPEMLTLNLAHPYWFWHTTKPVFGGDPPAFYFDPRNLANDSNGPTYPMPKMADLGNIAILSDMVCGSVYLDNTHREGVSVCHVDGSVNFVKRSLFDQYVSTKAWYDPSLNWNDTDIKNNINPIWLILDKY